jgi:hypothetical protein
MGVVPGRSTQSLAVMPGKLSPLLIPAVLYLLARRAVRRVINPPQFESGVTLSVTKTIAGTHDWDRGMASGMATITLQPGDVVECLGRIDTADLSILPVTDDIEAFVRRAVNLHDQPYVERNRLVVHVNGANLREHFAVRRRR